MKERCTMRTYIWTVPTRIFHWLLAIGFVIMFLLSCEKDDNKPSNTVTDIDGNVYHTITIGTQTWMIENLRTTRYNDGIAIPLVENNTAWSNLTTPAYCWYDNNETNKTTYGALYNWFTVETGKLCPVGWHVPSAAEWIILENYLADNGYNYDGTIGGGETKIAKSMVSTTGWNPSGVTGAAGNTDFSEYRNKSGFTAFPAGNRDIDGIYHGIGNICYWWMSEDNSEISAGHRYINFLAGNLATGYYYKPAAISVRCIKN